MASPPPVRRRNPVVWVLFGLAGRVSRGIYWLCFVIFVCLESALLVQLLHLSMWRGRAEFAILPVHERTRDELVKRVLLLRPKPGQSPGEAQTWQRSQR